MQIYSRSYHVGLLILSGILAMGLISCGTGNIPIVKPVSPYAISASRVLPDNDIEIRFEPSLTALPDGSTILLRRSEARQMVFEHYTADSLGVDWSIPIVTEKKESWSPIIKYQSGKIYCAGLDFYSDGDSIGFRYMSIDPTTHAIVSDRWCHRGYYDHFKVFHKPEQPPIQVAVSQDSNRFLIYQMDPLSDGSTPHRALTLHCHTYDITGTLLDSSVLSIALSKKYNGSVQNGIIVSPADYGLLKIMVDNLGNRYVVKRSANDTLEVITYPFRSVTASKTIALTLPDKEFLPEDHLLSVEYSEPGATAGKFDLIVSHRKEREGIVMEDVIVASVNTTTGQAQVFQYKPNADTLTKLIDRSDLEGYAPVKIVRESVSGNIMVVFENRATAGFHTTTSYLPTMNYSGIRANDWISTNYSYKVNFCNGFLFLGFEPSGRLAYQYSFPKKPSGTTDYSIITPIGSPLKFYYVERYTEPEGLYYDELDLKTGVLAAAKNVLEFKSSTYILSGYSLWIKPQQSIMFASGYTQFGGEFRMRNPMIFRLTGP